MKQLSLLVAVLLCSLCVYADSFEAKRFGPLLDVTLSEPGALGEVLTGENMNAEYLIVRGRMNSADFTAIKNCYSKPNGTDATGMFCIDLREATFEGNALPAGAFYNIRNNRLAKIILPETLDEIGEAAFCACVAKDINLPSSLTKIGKMAFSSSGISGNIVIPKGVTTIPSRAFEYTFNLESVDLSNVDSIGFHAFDESSLHEIYGPVTNKKIRIGMAAFRQVKVYEGLTFIQGASYGYEAFAETNARAILLNEGMTAVPSKLSYDNPFLEEIVIPARIRTIGATAFFNNSRLKTVVFENGDLTDIYQDAFAGTAIETLSLPTTLKTIRSGAFFNIPALTEIYSPMATPPDAEGAFGGSTRKDTPVYVPKGSKEAYETAPGWDYFTTFIEIDNTPGESGVDSPEGDDGIRVYAEGGRLRIEGAPQGTRYKVYTPDGRMVSAGDAAAPAALPSGSVYIVKVDGHGYKVML